MSDKAITVTEKSDGVFAVSVREGGGETRHEATLSAEDRARFGGDGRAIVEAAFRFLLDREPKEAILAQFDISVISRYFPGFVRELPRYLGKRDMKQAGRIFRIETRGRGLYDLTREVVRWLDGERFETGLLTLFCRHTSASLTIQENASPEVLIDMEAAFERLAPETPGLYAHADEGPDDMPAHIRAALTGASLSIPVIGGRMALGTWQGLYLFEHRRAPHRREVAGHVIGEHGVTRGA